MFLVPAIPVFGVNLAPHGSDGDVVNNIPSLLEAFDQHRQFIRQLA